MCSTCILLSQNIYTHILYAHTHTYLSEQLIEESRVFVLETTALVSLKELNQKPTIIAL